MINHYSHYTYVNHQAKFIKAKLIFKQFGPNLANFKNESNLRGKKKRLFQ